MTTSPRAAAWISLGLLAALAVMPLAPRLIAAAAAQPPTPALPATQLSPLARMRLLAALRSKIPIEPLQLARDPYIGWNARELPRSPTGTVCGVRFEEDRVHYRLATFASTQVAGSAGFAVTHVGACGTCSTLQDLAVYLEKPDLTAPVRKCGIAWNASASLKCLEALGFTPACAQTWLYDLQNTRRQCLVVCLKSWIAGEAPTQKDGRLNSCLQCDEDRSGPVFKATAGRTRRNSGIHSSIPRPADEVAPVVHDYVPDVATQ